MANRKVKATAIVWRAGWDSGDGLVMSAEVLAKAVAEFKTPAPLSFNFNAATPPVGRVLSLKMDGADMVAEVEMRDAFESLALRPSFRIGQVRKGDLPMHADVTAVQLYEIAVTPSPAALPEPEGEI